MASNKYGEPSTIRDTEKVIKIVDIILEDLPEVIPVVNGDEYNQVTIASFYDHIAHSGRAEWSERGNDIRFSLNSFEVPRGSRNFIFTGHVYFLAGKGWGKLTQERLDAVNKRFIEEVGDVTI